MNPDEKKDSSETESVYSAISYFLGMFISPLILERHGQNISNMEFSRLDNNPRKAKSSIEIGDFGAYNKVNNYVSFMAMLRNEPGVALARFVYSRKLESEMPTSPISRRLDNVIISLLLKEREYRLDQTLYRGCRAAGRGSERKPNPQSYGSFHRKRRHPKGTSQLKRKSTIRSRP